VDVKLKIITPAILLILVIQVAAQDTVNHKTVFPSGFFLGYGQGLYSVKDEYISREKYSGTLPYISLEWVRFRDKNGYRIKLEQRESGNIANNSISADVQQIVFNQDFIHFVGSFSLFSRNVYAYLGPSLQFLQYDIRYNFVNPGTFISPRTSGYIGSLGINTEFVYLVNSKFFVEGFLRSNVLALSGKDIDAQKYEDDPGPALLSVFTATKLDVDLYVRYYLVKRISISLGYKFDLSRISKWDPYIAASDNLIISLNFKFRP